VTPNEHDDTTAARESGDERADGLANGAAAPDYAAPPAGRTSDADGSEEGQFADESAEDAQFTPYLNSGANPFSSVHPPGEGVFPRLAPREFPRDEPPADVPAMEQLPDPNALPEPGYPVMAGYQQTFPPAASAFPPAPSAFSAEQTAFPPSTYAESPYSPQADPYAAPRSPEAAPPLAPSKGRPAATPHPGPHSGVRPPSRHEAAPPIAPVSPPPPVEPVGPPPRETADSLTTDSLLHGKRPQPAAGWRRTIYRASGGLIRVGGQDDDRRRARRHPGDAAW
jgi:hypothetical protein